MIVSVWHVLSNHKRAVVLWKFEPLELCLCLVLDLESSWSAFASFLTMFDWEFNTSLCSSVLTECTLSSSELITKFVCFRRWCNHPFCRSSFVSTSKQTMLYFCHTVLIVNEAGHGLSILLLLFKVWVYWKFNRKQLLPVPRDEVAWSQARALNSTRKFILTSNLQFFNFWLIIFCSTSSQHQNQTQASE